MKESMRNAVRDAALRRAEEAARRRERARQEAERKRAEAERQRERARGAERKRDEAVKKREMAQRKAHQESLEAARKRGEDLQARYDREARGMENALGEQAVDLDNPLGGYLANLDDETRDAINRALLDADEVAVTSTSDGNGEQNVPRRNSAGQGQGDGNSSAMSASRSTCKRAAQGNSGEKQAKHRRTQQLSIPIGQNRNISVNGVPLGSIPGVSLVGGTMYIDGSRIGTNADGSVTISGNGVSNNESVTVSRQSGACTLNGTRVSWTSEQRATVTQSLHSLATGGLTRVTLSNTGNIEFQRVINENQLHFYMDGMVVTVEPRAGMSTDDIGVNLNGEGGLEIEIPEE